MGYTQHTLPVPVRSFRLAPSSKAVAGVLLILFVLILSACGISTGGVSSATPTATSSLSPTVTTAPSTSKTTPSDGYVAKVYFSKFPDSLNNFSAVFPVNRISPTIAVATFSIQLLIAGPTLSERSSGYFSEFNSILTGPSSCSAPHPTGGPDFTLTLNMKGSKASPGTATLKLCRVTQSPGTGTDARILAEINATLKQFSNIKSVAVLTQNGHCLGDQSGQDLCLK